MPCSEKVQLLYVSVLAWPVPVQPPVHTEAGLVIVAMLLCIKVVGHNAEAPQVLTPKLALYKSMITSSVGFPNFCPQNRISFISLKVEEALKLYPANSL